MTGIRIPLGLDESDDPKTLHDVARILLACADMPLVTEDRNLLDEWKDPVIRDQSKYVGEDRRLRYSADKSEVFPGATGVRRYPCSCEGPHRADCEARS